MVPEKETRERILEVAFELFGSKGYNNVSMNEIVEKSGMSKGGIFHHFSSKYDLGRDSLIWWAQSHMEPLLNENMMAEMDPKDILTHVIDFMIDFMGNDSTFTKFFWSIFDESIKRNEDSSVWMDFLNGFATVIEGIYAKMGVKDPKMKALIFLSNLDGIALYNSMMKDLGIELDLKALKEELVRTYVTFDEEVKT